MYSLVGSNDIHITLIFYNTIVLDQILEDILHNEHQKYLTTGASCKGIFGWIAVSVYQGQLLKNNGSKDLSLQLISGDIKDGLIIDGTPVHLCDWSTMLLNQISKLEEFFTSHLTFGEYSLSADILAIYDTTKPMRENFSFLDWPENEKLKLHRVYGELLAFWVSAVSEGHKQKVHELLKINHADQSLSFFKAGIQEYAKNRSVFLKALAPLLHLTSGMPGRGPEMLGIRFRNTAVAQRNIFILQGKITIITTAWKGMHLTGRERVIPRVPAPRVARLLFLYITIIEPLERYMMSQSKQTKYFVDSAFLFPQHNKPDEFYSTTVLENKIREMTLTGLRIALNVQKNRHIQKTWARFFLSKEVITSLRSISKDFIDDEEDFCDLNNEESLPEDPVDLQMGHGMKTAQDYGLTLGTTNALTFQRLTAFQVVSAAVHKLFKIDEMPDATPSKCQGDVSCEPTRTDADSSHHNHDKEARASTDLSQDDNLIQTCERRLQTQSNKLYKRLAYDNDSCTPTHRLPNITDKVKAVVGGNGQIKSIEQGQCLDLIYHAAPCSTTLIVMPTGSGKSLLMLLKYDEKATIVVVPLQALLEQHIVHCKHKGLQYLHWQSGTENYAWAPIILVSFDSAVTKKFISYAVSHIQQGVIGRLMVDECHLALQASPAFRSNLLRAGELRALDVPSIYLTATLPPKDIPRFKALFLLDNSLNIMRQSTNRSNVHIRVCSGENENHASGMLKVMLDKYIQHLDASERILIFWNNTNSINRFASVHKYHRYYSALHDKANQLLQWLSPTSKSSVMVASCALECGIDYAKHKRLAVLAGMEKYLTISSFISIQGLEQITHLATKLPKSRSVIGNISTLFWMVLALPAQKMMQPVVSVDRD
ncbi:protein of unknown function [Taphrina deformans PYCC 5710]|uniref:Helicase ATP-binding domain-containing protein n=1 Tax=Taphrina deformans (strain PYCC 5710 / ATCC 11124 / CBS 356.35 / IMI 108563 / JCM 9778 / NBRC 8474) TaxID=1097556 RepID=R4XH24_TAPDE|nr:protein of unknown function [Taphrina deformans PYCC 5710]|eukprot:CCG85096.1 protein of unknown function [Taphrina deformans PYCC 5710]